MSIVRGTVGVYRGASDGFIGDEGATGSTSGTSGVFGDASNYPAVTVSNGLVTAVSTFPRAVGTTGVFGDANNYPVLTVVNGDVTAVSTQPRSTGVSTTVGSAFTRPVFTTVSGQVTVASSVPNYWSSVCWTAAASVAFGALAPVSFTSVAYDSLDVISQTTAGTSMTISNTGLYYVSCMVEATVANQLRAYKDGVSITGAVQQASSVNMWLQFVYPFTAGNVLTFATNGGFTSTAATRFMSVVRLQ